MHDDMPDDPLVEPLLTEAANAYDALPPELFRGANRAVATQVRRAMIRRVLEAWRRARYARAMETWTEGSPAWMTRYAKSPQKSESKETSPATPTAYALTRRSKKLASSRTS